jgi:hypothetical protein
MGNECWGTEEGALFVLRIFGILGSACGAMPDCYNFDEGHVLSKVRVRGIPSVSNA